MFHVKQLQKKRYKIKCSTWNRNTYNPLNSKLFHVKHRQNKPKTGQNPQKHPKKADFGGFQKVSKQKKSKAKPISKPQLPMEIPPRTSKNSLKTPKIPLFAHFNPILTRFWHFRECFQKSFHNEMHFIKNYTISIQINNYSFRAKAPLPGTQQTSLKQDQQSKHIFLL